jgi:ribosomal protein S18 acetylase RimI-like enzyme
VLHLQNPGEEKTFAMFEFSADGHVFIGKAMVSMSYGKAHICNVWLEADHRGQGYGKQMMREVLEWTRERFSEATLSVYATNKRAIHIYESLGFRVTRPQAPEDTILRMRLAFA